jgi:PD-(D/E)XK nuclease superfamily
VPKDLALFGTKEWPLHPSGMRGIVVCPWRAVMRFLAEGGPEESGQAADTGSAMHKAAAAFHKGGDQADSIQVMRDHSTEYPLADLVEAAQLFLDYSRDDRNRTANVVLCEERVDFSIAPAAEDKTQARIEVEATTDQVRFDGYRHKAWDIKTSKRDPTELLAESWFQMAGYCIGASVKLSMLQGKTVIVEPGGIITPRRYKDDPSTSKVFHHHNFKFDWVEQLLLPVRKTVAAIRNGEVWHVPNADCRWCHQKTPDVCFPKLIEFLELRKQAA